MILVQAAKIASVSNGGWRQRERVQVELWAGWRLPSILAIKLNWRYLGTFQDSNFSCATAHYSRSLTMIFIIYRPSAFKQ